MTEHDIDRVERKRSPAWIAGFATGVIALERGRAFAALPRPQAGRASGTDTDTPRKCRS